MKLEEKDYFIQRFQEVATAEHLLKIRQLLEPIEDFSAENIKNALWEYATARGRKHVLWPMRYALSGKEKSSDPFTIASIIGKEATTRRLKKAAELLIGDDEWLKEIMEI